MTRPTFRLSDDAARILVARMQGINDLHPLNQRDHRPFLHAYIGAVHAGGRSGRDLADNPLEYALGDDGAAGRDLI